MSRSLASILQTGGLIGLTCLPAWSGDVVLSAGIKGAAAVSGAGGSVSAVMPTLECQFALGQVVSLTAGIGSLSYSYSDTGYAGSGSYTEDGRGTAVSVDVKFYPGRKALNGFYVGPGLGVVPVSVDWKDTRYTYTAERGTYSGTGLEVHAKLGWMIPAGSVRIDPHVQVGYFLAMPASSNRSATMSVFVMGGVNVGIRF